MNLSREQQWKVGGGATIMLVILLPLWGILRVPGATIWNAVLALILACLFVGTIFLQRHLLRNIDQVGEARVDTRNK
jgi:cobalamin biosynthesis protein CobD/CbiB